MISLSSISLSASRTGCSSSYSKGLHSWCSVAGQGLLAMASGRLVCLYDVAAGRIVGVLGGHQVDVRAVRWMFLPNANSYGDEVEVASCGGDGLIKVWRIEHKMVPGAVGVPWEQCGELRGHSGAVCSISTLHLRGNDGDVIASTGTDCTLRVWYRAREGESGFGGCGEWTASCCTSLRAPCEAVSLSRLPNANTLPSLPLHALIIAAAGADCKIHLFGTLQHQENSSGTPPLASSIRLSPLASLSGHGNWVRSLAFSEHVTLKEHFPISGVGNIVDGEAEEEGVLFLASGAQDGKCRLWRVVCAKSFSPGGIDSRDKGGGVSEIVKDSSLSSEFLPPLRAGRGLGEKVEGDDDEEEEEEEEEGKQDVFFPMGEEKSDSGVVGSASLGEGVPMSVEGAGLWYVTCYALLSGHLGWVTSVSWSPSLPPTPPPMELFSCSMHKSVIIWRPKLGGSGGVWFPAAKLTPTGEVCGSGKDGSSLGLNGVFISPPLLLSNTLHSSSSSSSQNPLVNNGSVLLTPHMCATVCTINIRGALCAWSHVSVHHNHSHNQCDGFPPIVLLPSVTGHHGSLTSLVWAPCGTYLVSTSKDCSTRTWRAASVTTTTTHHSKDDASSLKLHFVEVSRPMLHGWPVNCAGLCSIEESPAGSRRKSQGHALVVASAEKILRVLHAPLHFCYAVGGDSEEMMELLQNSTRPEYAYVPELGLSAKGVHRLSSGTTSDPRCAPSTGILPLPISYSPHFSDAHQADGKDAMPLDKSGQLSRAADAGGAAGILPMQLVPLPSPPPSHHPQDNFFSLVRGPLAPMGRPTEAALTAHGRWVEANKLYGHAGEVSCVITSSNGRFAASGGAGRSELEASVLVWDLWKGSLLGKPLLGHRLSVSALAWSSATASDGVPEHLFSCSRDRTIGIWGLYCGSSRNNNDHNNNSSDQTSGSSVVGGEKPLTMIPLALFSAHKRQVLALSVAPSLPKRAPEPEEEGRGDEPSLFPSSWLSSFFASGSRDGAVRLWALVRTAVEAEITKTTKPALEGLKTATDASWKGETVSAESGTHSIPLSSTLSCVSRGSLPPPRSACTPLQLAGDGGSAIKQQQQSFREIASFSPPPKDESSALPSVTSLAFAPRVGYATPPSHPFFVLAVGYENGVLDIWKVPIGGFHQVADLAPPVVQLLCVPRAHAGPVECLAWKPFRGGEEKLMLSSGGSDGSLAWWDVAIEF